jgi:aspartate aminotransferase-like enzyme
MPEATAPPVQFKIAAEDWEFEEVHRLNYQTFVEEIPQHPTGSEPRLVDRFHDQNTYFIALRGRRLLGMMSLRSQRPFSLDQKLPDLDRYLPPGRNPCEVRLLATLRAARNGYIFRGLVNLLAAQGLSRGHDLAVISGTLRQIKLYRHLGFVPFGPIVGTGDALYQPMYLTLEDFCRKGKAFAVVRKLAAARRAETLNFLPGPVPVDERVAAAFHQPAVSHRSCAFVRDFQATRQRLCQLARAANVQIMMGSGTVGNDAIAAQLSLDPGPGVILSNGAFGERLLDHATRFGLRFQTLSQAWGRSFTRDSILRALDQAPPARWLWAVHGETSTGVLNDLEFLKRTAAERGMRLCLDIVSTLGNVPVDLGGVALAASVSGKGLAAFPGLALVFHEATPQPAPTLPRYLDIGFYGAHEGIPFTMSSNLVYALKAAVEQLVESAHLAQIAQLAAHLRRGLADLGLHPVAEEPDFLAVTTVALPKRLSSLAIGQSLEDAGFLINYRSGYLPPRNWLQFCLMGVCSQEGVNQLLAALQTALASHS